jgi:peptide/nickel transport system substrate-binding protein
VRYTPGEEVVLEANDDYWDGRPKIDRLVLRIYPDQRTGFQALLIGDVDILAVTPALWQQARESDQAGRLRSFAFYRNSVWTVRWKLDGTNPFFDDPRVRRALIHALDRRRFIDATLNGMGRVAATSYHPDLAWTDPDLEPLPFDPGRAERELDEAGWRRPGPGRLRERDGTPFRFTLMTANSTMQVADRTAAWLQQSWADIGVRADIEKLEWGEFRERRREGRFDAAMGGFSMTPTPDQWELYHSGARAEGANYGGYADPETDRLLDLGRRTLDPAERLHIYHDLQRRLLEQQPIGWLMHFASPVLHDRRLGGVEPSVLDYWRTTRGPRVWTWAAEADDG